MNNKNDSIPLKSLLSYLADGGYCPTVRLGMNLYKPYSGTVAWHFQVSVRVASASLDSAEALGFIERNETDTNYQVSDEGRALLND